MSLYALFYVILQKQKERQQMIKLIADSGSTKTDWCLVDEWKVIKRISGQGINPYQQQTDEISRILKNEVADRLGGLVRVDGIRFYGAGCRDEMTDVMADLLRRSFPDAVSVEVCSDMVGAARALFGSSEGIACILGTGANSCVYDGRDIVANVPPLGFILGDEGSGAVLGRLFVNALFKGHLSDFLREDFLKESGLSLSEIIERVYRRPLANRFLAGMSPFIHRHLDDSSLREIVVGNFRDFFSRNVSRYGRSDLPLGAVGGMAYYYENELREAAGAEGYTVSVILKSPIDGLVLNS